MELSTTPSQRGAATLEALDRVRQDLSAHCDAVFQAMESSIRPSREPDDASVVTSSEKPTETNADPGNSARGE